MQLGSPRRRLLAVLATTSLLTAACGARWTDEQAASVAARYTAAADSSPTGSDAAPAVSTGGGPQTAGGGTERSRSTQQADEVAGASGREEVADAGTGQGVLPCTAPSEAPGVSDDELTIGAISSLSGPVPGLAGSSAAAARAYVAYRNANGGVCGREVVLKAADDGTDNGRYRSILTEFTSTVLGIAGGFAVGDVGGEDIVASSRIPIVNGPSGETGRQPTVFDINPPFANPNATIGKYRYLRDQGATEVSMVYTAVDQARAEAKLQRSLMEAAGLEIVQVQELPLSTLSHDSAARGVANSGANYLFFIGDPNANASMARSLEDTGYEVTVAEYFAFAYQTAFADLAGSAAEGATTWLRSLPNEEAGSNEELARFLEWMQRVAPTDPAESFAADSWVSLKVFLDSLEALPGAITREALVAQLSSIGTYDAGGMFGPIELGQEQNNGCSVGIRYNGGQWRRIAPDQGFLC